MFVKRLRLWLSPALRVLALPFASSAQRTPEYYCVVDWFEN